MEGRASARLVAYRCCCATCASSIDVLHAANQQKCHCAHLTRFGKVRTRSISHSQVACQDAHQSINALLLCLYSSRKAFLESFHMSLARHRKTGANSYGGRWKTEYLCKQRYIIMISQAPLPCCRPLLAPYVVLRTRALHHLHLLAQRNSRCPQIPHSHRLN